MSSSKKIFSGVYWSIITNVVNALYGFIMIPILISYFGKAEYGLIGLAQSVNAYMRLMDLGLTSTNVRFFSNWLAKGDHDGVRKLFSTCTAFYGIIGVINSLILLFVYFYSDTIFNVTEYQDAILKDLLLILIASAIVNWFTSCYNQIIQATENVAWTQKRLLITKVLMVAVLLLTIYCRFSIQLYFFLTVLCNWLILPWVVKKIKNVAPMVSFMPKFDKQVFKEILPYTLNIFSFSIFSFSYNNLKPVLLGMQSTPESVTDYKVLMGIVGIISTVSGVFMSSLLPSSSKVIANNNKEGFYKIAYQGTKYIMCFMGFCVFGMLCIAKDLLTIYVGESYDYLVPWLNIFIFLMLTNHILAISSLILGGSNIRPLSKMTAVSSVTSLIVAWFLIPTFGVGGVAMATILYNIVQMLFYYSYYLPKVMEVNSWLILKQIVFPVTIVGSIIWTAFWRLPHFESNWVNILVFGSMFTIIYLCFLSNYLNKEDKQFILSLLKKK